MDLCVKLSLKRAKNELCGTRVVSVFVSPHHPPAEKGAHTLNLAGKRTRRPERVVRAAGGLHVLDSGAGCDTVPGVPVRSRCGCRTPP